MEEVEVILTNKNGKMNINVKGDHVTALGLCDFAKTSIRNGILCNQENMQVAIFVAKKDEAEQIQTLLDLLRKELADANTN